MTPPGARPFTLMARAINERESNHYAGASALALPASMVANAAALTQKLWRPGRTVRVRYFGGSKASRDIADAALTRWEPLVNLKFVPVTSGPSEVRVAFQPGGGAWSYLGTDALAVPQHQPTMNLGWDDLDTATHEFGHTLGLIHEHSNPDADIPWDAEAVYRYYAGPPNRWDRATTRANVLGVYSERVLTNGGFDNKSIMLYPIPAEHLTDPARAVGWNRGLSAGDIALARRLYPKGGLAGSATNALNKLLRN